MLIITTLFLHFFLSRLDRTFLRSKTLGSEPTPEGIHKKRLQDTGSILASRLSFFVLYHSSVSFECTQSSNHGLKNAE
ncbi:hypothetical protein ACN38_g6966 [Penicillium nordicum]|uniref:Uncharacterized protein n=1 Tax=Penicillium nordicum TaxID=229535 RepID=A0A0N0RYL7_9EURO|nr:hypothetical protein ACN38_g6966 [Penicillium nordicum]